MVSLSLSCAVWPGLKLWSTDDEFMFALVWTIWLTLNRVKFYKIPRELIRLSSILILSVGTTFIQILVYTGFRSTFNHVWSRFKTLIGRRWEWTKVVELVNLRVGEFCSFVCLSTSAATLSYQFHLPRTYFSPTFPYGDIFTFPLRSPTLHEITPRLHLQYSARRRPARRLLHL